MNSHAVGQNGRVFGLQISNNTRQASVAGRRKTQHLPPGSHIDKAPPKQERESIIIEKPVELQNQMDIELQGPEEPKDAVEIYESDIGRYLIRLEQKRPSVTNYFQLQPDVSLHMRGILLNWLVQVHLKYKLLPQTLFVAIGIIDRYLEKSIIHRSRLQLLGITSLWIAAKFEEIYQVPKISNLIFICDSTYTKSDILEMEGNILLTLDFDLLETHAYTYLQLFNKQAELDEKDYFLARYLLEICLLDFRMVKYPSRCVAAASIFFIKKIRRRVPSWDQALQHVSLLAEADLKQCARDVCQLLQSIDENEHMEALKKKFSSQQFREVGKIKIGEKPRQ